MKEYPPYNPLDKMNLGASVAEAMLATPALPLATLEPFTGAGIYALYYTGDFPAYRRLSERNREGRFAAPIYVGKAVPPGARKGGFGLDADPGQVLRARLKEHAESVTLAENLRLEDFFCRFLVVEDIWIPLGEALLIAKFSPIWNKLLEGFGNHAPGSGRYRQMRSKWDVLHPGRAWALKCSDRRESPRQLADEIEAHLRGAAL